MLRWATAHRVPVVPRGAGSSLSGGSTGGRRRHHAVARSGCAGSTIDPVTRVAVAQPGAFNAEVKAAAAEHGLWYPPDPSSFEICSIGGNAATNAGGLCCVKYGVTTDYVLGHGGRARRRHGGAARRAAAQGRRRAVADQAVRRLRGHARRDHRADPAAAARAAAGVARWSRRSPSIEAAADAVVAITAQLRPSMLELMDNGSINAVEDLVKMGLDRDGRRAAARPLRRARRRRRGRDRADGARPATALRRRPTCSRTDDADEGEAFAAARRAAFPAMERLGDAAARGRRRAGARAARRSCTASARSPTDTGHPHRRRRARRRRQHPSDHRLPARRRRRPRRGPGWRSAR